VRPYCEVFNGELRPRHFDVLKISLRGIHRLDRLRSWI
jgi:hypothetical protein